MLHFRLAGLRIGPKLGTPEVPLAQNQRPLDMEQVWNGGHWKWNWLEIGLDINTVYITPY